MGQVIKENKLLFIWWAVAYVTAFFSFYSKSGTNYELSENNNDTLIYFSFTETQKEELADYFDRKNKFQGFNGVVLVGQRDSIFYFEPFGYADYQKHDSFTINSTFQLASVSKQFTAVAILQLAQKGLVNLTDSVQKFYADFPYKGITIHQLLTHRSGLANYQYFFQYIPTTFDTIIYNKDIIAEMVLKVPKPYYRPNQRYHYSNTGYAILAAIVEKVSGMKFNEYVKANIFEPLEMQDSYTFLDLKLGEREKNTMGYLYRWRPEENNYLDGVLGDKGVYSSAADLFKWDQGLYSGKIIDVALLNRAFEPMGKPISFSSNYGYGWRMFNLYSDSVKVLFHGGWWHGYKSLLIRIPGDSTTIIVLKNRSKGGSINSKKLLKILYPDTNSLTDTAEVDNEE